MSLASPPANEHKRIRRRRTPPERHCEMGQMWISSKGEGGGSHSKNKSFWLLKLKDGMGCKSVSCMPPSAPAIIRSAAEWETKEKRNGNHKSKKKKKRGLRNAAVDVPDACCASPGTRISSDFSTRIRNPVPKIDRLKLAWRNGCDSRSSSFGIDSHSVEEITEITMSLRGGSLCYDHLWNTDGLWFGISETPNPGSFTRAMGEDPYHDLRLDVEEMSYEELLDLGDKIGYVGTGLEEQEIPECLRIIKDFTWLPANEGQRDWICSICQEKYGGDNEIGVLECTHHHHAECIKQWLLKKNSCPICKCAAKKRKAA